MAAEQKTIAQLLRCSEEQAAAFARRVQDLVGAPVSAELIAAAMQKVKAKDIASPQRVAEYISLEMERRAKGITTTKRSTRTQATSAEGTAKKPRRTKAPHPAEGTPEEAASARERSEQLERARQRSVMAQLDRLLEENWVWASAQKYEVPPKRWAADEFVREVRRAVFTDKSPLPKILRIARSLHADKWILTPGAVADVILREIAEKEGE
jgi:hypothetical protein